MAGIDATNEYLKTEDSIGTWIDERCECKPSFEDTSAKLFASWKSWAELNGEPAGSQKQFAEKMQSRGFDRKVIGHRNARGYSGIRVIAAEQNQTDSYWDR